MDSKYNDKKINGNNNLIVCDSSAVFLFADIYSMLTSGAEDEKIRKKVMNTGTSLPEDYYRGAVGLLLLAIDKKVRLVVDPICLKELCVQGDFFHKKFICFLFKQKLLSLIWPKDLHDCVAKVRKRISLYTNKVGTLRRNKIYSKRTHSYEDYDLNDKQSSSEIDYIAEKGGYLIRLDSELAQIGQAHTFSEIVDIVIEQCEAEAKNINNLVPDMRRNIVLRAGDQEIQPKQVIMHVHRNNTDFGDSITDAKAYKEINDVSNVYVCSFGDLYRHSESIKCAYDGYSGNKLEVKPIEPPYSVERIRDENLVARRYSLNKSCILSEDKTTLPKTDECLHTESGKKIDD